MTYKEARAALERNDGNVVDAIIDIEESVDNDTSTKRIGTKGQEILGKMKEIVKKGNVARITVSKDGTNILNLPVNAGVLGAVVAPWGMIIGVIAAFGFKCQIEMIKDDGSIVDITDRAGNIYEDAKTRGGKIVDDLKEKAPGVYETVREKGEEAVNKVSEFAKEQAERIRAEKDDFFNDEDGFFTDEEVGLDEAAEKAEEAVDEAAEEVKDAAEEAAEKAEDLAEEIKTAAEEIGEAAEEAAEEIKED